jgi:hypothetical protein
MLALLSPLKLFRSSIKQRQILKCYDIVRANARRYRAGAAQKHKGPQLCKQR